MGDRALNKYKFIYSSAKSTDLDSFSKYFFHLMLDFGFTYIGDKDAL